MIGKTYYERGQPVVVLARWNGKGPRNVLIERQSKEQVIRPFRGLRKNNMPKKINKPEPIPAPEPEQPEITPDREFSQQLRVDLTNDELVMKAKDFADEQNKLDQEKSDKKRIVSEYGSRIKAIEAHITKLAYTVSTGHELREVRCGMFFDTPEKGKKSFIRLDTKEVVSVEEMSETDRQLSLPITETIVEKTNGESE